MLQPSLRGTDGSYGSSALPDAFKVRTAQLSEGALTIGRALKHNFGEDPPVEGVQRGREKVAHYVHRLR